MSEKLFVLGHPVAHSKSPVMHNAAYRALGLDWEYGLADRSTEDEARGFLEQRDWLGLNVTTPWKPLAFAAADIRSEEAELAGGANVLMRRGDDLLADNTDGAGCVEYLARCGVDLKDAKVSVCGTGPTALSIAYAVLKANVRSVTVHSRERMKAAKAADRLLAGCSPSMGCRLRATAYSRDLWDIKMSDVVIDATPLGMNPDDPAPFDTSVLSAGQVVFDVVYAHGDTALVRAAREAGCTAFNGAGMLVAQAVESVRDFIEWSGAEVDLEGVDLFAIMNEAAGF